MSLVKCQACHERIEGKPFRVYFHWQRADGVRKGYRTRLCLTCYASKLVPLDVERDAQSALTCPNCGIITDEDFDAVYANGFIPGYGMRQIEAPFCGVCAANYRAWVIASSEELEASGGGPRDPPPQPSGDQILRSLGIEPRHGG